MRLFRTLLLLLLHSFIFNGGSIEGANILVYGLIASHSARISMTTLMNGLANRGHNVTYFSPFGKDPDSSKTASKFHIYEPRKWKEHFGTWEEQMGFFEIRKRGLIFKWWYDLKNVGVEACKVLYSDPEYLDWVKNAPKFDMIIVEISLNECAYGLVRLWGSKLVVYSTTTVVPWMMDIHGVPDESSSISDTSLRFASSWTGGMSFLERLQNALVPILFTLTWQYSYLPQLEEITRKGLQISEEENKRLSSFWEIGRNTSLVLLSTHLSLDFPRSLPPHFVEIGGIVVPEKNQLPVLSEEIKSFIESAHHGFIYISFGTLAEFTSFDLSVQLEFIKGLEMFPEMKFIWKSSTDISLDLPQNVMVTKWAPQQSLLAHSKIKAFISHAGMGSITESVHFAVPLICLPIHAEQELHSNAVVQRGAGIKLEILTLTRIELESAIREILSNERYRHAMSDLSNIFKDRPTPPLENALWRIEHLLRHNSSNDYMIPLSSFQPWWKRRQIDVWIILGLIIFLFLFLCFTIVVAGVYHSFKIYTHIIKTNKQFCSKRKQKFKKR